jgi:hypothetical protein
MHGGSGTALEGWHERRKGTTREKGIRTSNKKRSRKVKMCKK